MGNRGPLPATRPVYAEPLASSKAPDELDTIGREYYRRHFNYCTEAGLLTSATVDAYILCCSLYSRLRAMDLLPTSRVYLDTQKSWQALAKIFRLMPTEQPSKEVKGRHDGAPLFNPEDE